MCGYKQWRKVRRAVLQAVALVCACTMLGACGTQKTEPDRVNLADVVLAVGLNPHSKDVIRANTGLVALVHKDGTADFIDTKGMSPQNMAWNDSGLFFDDSDNHFYISRDPGHGYVSKRDNASAAGITMAPVGDDAVLAMYQGEYAQADDSTTVQMQWLTPKPQTLVTSPAALPDAVAQCASGTFATARSNDDPGSYVLYEISETDGMKQVDSKPVTEQFVPGTSTGAVPCVGDELVLFGGVSDGAKGNGYGSQTLTLLKWNVKTHELTQENATQKNGEPQLYVGETSFFYGQDLTTDAGEMIAMSTNGDVEFIDMRTMRITRSKESPQLFDVGTAQYDIAGSDAYAYMIFTPTSGSKDDAKIFVYRTSDWALVHTIDAQGTLNDLLSNRKELYPTVFAANPAMSWD